VIALVYTHTGVRMTSSKRTMLKGRLRSRIQERQSPSLGAYLDLVQSDLTELQRFIDVVTTHETYFHRTARIWEYLAKDFLPNWWTQHPGQALKIWSAASSTGEESYTLAMYCEEFSRSHLGFKYSVVASDISREVVDCAQKARYQGRSLEALQKANPLFVETYTSAINSEIREIRPEIRTKVKFQQENLLNLKSVRGPFDLVLLRNVLIYFDTADQEKVVANVSRQLALEGVLVIGESESLSQLKTDVVFLQPLIYARRRAA
jgi:chemotaxis protein methyltransferase CheR